MLATAHQLVSTLRAGRRGHAALGAACATLATPLQTAALGVGDARGFCLCLRLCQTHEHGVGPNGREDSEGRSVLRLAIEVLETAPLELTPHALQRACRDELFRIRIHDPAHEDDCMRACIHRAVTRILSLFGGEGLQHALIPAPCAVEDHLEPPPDGARARLQARLGLCGGIGWWTVVRCEVARRCRALGLARRRLCERPRRPEREARGGCGRTHRATRRRLYRASCEDRRLYRASCGEMRHRVVSPRHRVLRYRVCRRGRACQRRQRRRGAGRLVRQRGRSTLSMEDGRARRGDSGERGQGAHGR